MPKGNGFQFEKATNSSKVYSTSTRLDRLHSLDFFHLIYFPGSFFKHWDAIQRHSSAFCTSWHQHHWIHSKHECTEEPEQNTLSSRDNHPSISRPQTRVDLRRHFIHVHPVDWFSSHCYSRRFWYFGCCRTPGKEKVTNGNCQAPRYMNKVSLSFWAQKCHETPDAFALLYNMEVLRASYPFSLLTAERTRHLLVKKLSNAILNYFGLLQNYS